VITVESKNKEKNCNTCIEIKCAEFRDVNGARKSPFYILTKEDIQKLKEDIRAIEAKESVFVFNCDLVRGTGYIDAIDIIAIRGNVFPDTTSDSNHPRDIMSARAVLAHEYYGHRTNRGTNLVSGCREDEYRASRTAAEITPNLTNEERTHLILDAIERKREAGIVADLDSFMRRLLYGD